jgi:predicted glycosyltransferase
MRVWVDLTNSPHVLVMRPLIEAMRADGHEVEVTARDFAQTLELCERFGIEHTPIGDPDQVDVERRAEHNGLRIRRDPRELVTLLLSATDA